MLKHVSDPIEVVRQKFARKVQRQRLAETKLAFVGDREVVLLILDVIWQFILELVQLGKFGTPIDFARPPAQEGLMQPTAACNEFEREEYLLKAGGHSSAFSSKRIFQRSSRGAFGFGSIGGQDGGADLSGARHSIMKLGEILLRRLHRLEQNDKSALTYRLIRPNPLQARALGRQS